MTEYLVYFPAKPAHHNGRYIGTAPAHYELCKSRRQRDDAVAYGGQDVSNNPADWDEWRRIEQSAMRASM